MNNTTNSKPNFNTFATDVLKQQGYTKSMRRSFWRFHSGDWLPPQPFILQWNKLLADIRVQYFNNFSLNQ